ncbi:MAG: hypothetical protein BGO98_28680 [Myxococcales bacterium 68-20]|nr:MAG: hypothetical protein BGO98_28680 [Myxococcales bacterium 68-20]
MKIPTRILGLLVATIAAPVIAGCAGEVDDADSNKTQSNLRSKEPPPAGEPTTEPSSAATPAPNAESASAPDHPEEPEQPEEPEEPCPYCGMG